MSSKDFFQPKTCWHCGRKLDTSGVVNWILKKSLIGVAVQMFQGKQFCSKHCKEQYKKRFK